MYSCNLCNEDLDGKNFWRCSECTVAIYCGKNCQRSDWKVHKRHCKDLKSYVLLQKEKAKDEHSKIEDDTYERRILDLDIRTVLEKEDIHNWVKDHPWPSEEKIRSWIKDKTPSKITTDTESNLILLYLLFQSYVQWLHEFKKERTFISPWRGQKDWLAHW